MPPCLEWRHDPAEEPGVGNPALGQGAATFGQALDMRDSRPAEKLSTGPSDEGVSTPHGRDLPNREPMLQKEAIWTSCRDRDEL